MKRNYFLAFVGFGAVIVPLALIVGIVLSIAHQPPAVFDCPEIDPAQSRCRVP